MLYGMVRGIGVSAHGVIGIPQTPPPVAIVVYAWPAVGLRNISGLTRDNQNTEYFTYVTSILYIVPSDVRVVQEALSTRSQQ